MELPADLSRLSLEPIGILRCQQQTRVEAPRQPAAATHLDGVIELLPGHHYEHALEDLQGWERLWVIFWFHRNTGWRPKVLPPRSDSGRKGVFSTRSPHRPNPLGLSVLRLSHVEGLNVHVHDVDLLDGTPILDIKPYVPYSDAFPASGQGWLQPADPRPDHEVLFSAEAEQQLLWIDTHDMRVPLRNRVIETLRLGPQPHPYRRIRKRHDGQLQLAVKDWRLPFVVEDRRLTVLRVESGYQAGQLDADRPDPDGRLALHRAFSALRTCA